MKIKFAVLLVLLAMGGSLFAQQPTVTLFGSGAPGGTVAYQIGTHYIDQSVNPAVLYVCSSVSVAAGPTPPAGTQTCNWTQAGGGGGSTQVSVPCTATPTFTMGATFITDFFVNLSCSVTSSTITIPTIAGAEAVFTLTQDSTGGRTFAWPANFLNIPTLATAANATTVVTFQYCGAVGNGNACPANSWQNTDVGPAGAANAFDTGGIYVAKSCGGAVNCFPVVNDARYDTSATFTATSTTVTTSNNAPAFVSSTDVGTVEWGSYNCQDGTGSPCTYNCPQSTISSISSAHVAIVGVACTNTSVNVGSPCTNSCSIFVWGHDDGSQLQAAMSAALGASSSGPTFNIYLPCGGLLTTLPPFIVASNGGKSGTIGISGCGGGGTMVFIAPKMNCTGGFGKGCMISDPCCHWNNAGQVQVGSHFRDITFYGGGTQTHDAAATYAANTAGVAITYNDLLENVFVLGWSWNDATGVIGIVNNGGMMINSGSYAGGNTNCTLVGAAGTVATMFGGTCLASQGTSLSFSGGANQSEATYGVYLGQSRGSFGVNLNDASTWFDHGSNITGSLRVQAGQAVLSGTNLDQFGAGNSALVLTGGTARLSNTNVHSSGAGSPAINQSGGTIIDGCANVVNNTGATNNIYTAGVVLGTCSIAANITNTVVASRNTSLGSTTLIAAGGSGMYWPALLTIRLYAYDSAAGSGCSTNTTVTWTLSYTDLTGTAQTQTATETIVNNGGATGGDKLAVTFTISAGNGTALTYSTTYAIGTCTTGPSYAANITVT